MKGNFFFIALLGLAITGSPAQEITPTEPFLFNVDHARFRYDDTSGYLEIYYAFYPHLLTYRWSEGEFRTGVRLRTRLKNRGTNVLLLDDRALVQTAAADTTEASSRYPFISQSGYAVPFGEYTLEVVAGDSLAPSRRDSLSFNINISAYGAGTVFSDLELCGSVKRSQQTDNPFFKNSLEVVPNPTLVFGVTAHPVVFHYVEMYGLDPGESYTVLTRVMDSDGDVARESSKSRTYGMRDAIDVGTTNVTSILSGRYGYQLLILDEQSQEMARATKTLYVYNPHLQVPSLTAPVFQEMELVGLSDERLMEEFRQARYIATREEIQAFAQLKTEEDKRKFLAEFWVDIEGGRLGRQPMRRAVYLKRVEDATGQFSAMGKEGWRSDRGRAYILYGQADEVDRYPSRGESKPYEIWRYHSIESGVEFVFINRLGFGDYELVHSTKRDEFRDDLWRRFLR